VDFESEEAANASLVLDGTTCEGRILSVQHSNPPTVPKNSVAKNRHGKNGMGKHAPLGNDSTHGKDILQPAVFKPRAIGRGKRIAINK
jgi:hypothetical protein